MSVDNSVNGKTEGPFIQFDECAKGIDCKYKNESGRCIYETCIYDNEHPPTMVIMSFKCKVCDEVAMRDPRMMKIQICDQCLERMLAAEKKPFSCVFCGNNQSHNSKIFLSGICDDCFGKIDAAMNCKHCGR